MDQVSDDLVARDDPIVLINEIGRASGVDVTRTHGYHASAALGSLPEVVGVVLGWQFLFIIEVGRMARDDDSTLKIILA